MLTLNRMAASWGLCCTLALIAPLVSASASERATGGLIAYGAVDVSLIRQDLHISPDLIRVAYIFHSSTSQHATLAFPMPPVPVQGGSDFLGGAEINEADPRNYLHFSVRVDGRAVQPDIAESAFVGELDVGDALRSAGLPLLLAPDSASDLIAALPAEQFYPLEEARIVSRGGDDPPHFSPLWSYQATLAWQQSFRPGETMIEINYRPLTGIVENPTEFLRSPAMATKYCFGTEVAKAAGSQAEVVTLSYLTAMTPFWKGPIGEFNLLVDRAGENDPRGEAASAAYCPLVGQQMSSAKDFTPSRNLDIAFVFSRSPAP